MTGIKYKALNDHFGMILMGNWGIFLFNLFRIFCVLHFCELFQNLQNIENIVWT